MTYLTQALLDYATVARLRLRDIYDWHQAAWKAFPGRDGRQRDFLTRLDRLEEQEQFRLLIVSPVEPIRPDWCPADPEAWKTKPIPTTYFLRRLYRFRLRANPTKKIRVDQPDGACRSAPARNWPLGSVARGKPVVSRFAKILYVSCAWVAKPSRKKACAVFTRRLNSRAHWK